MRCAREVTVANVEVVGPRAFCLAYLFQIDWHLDRPEQDGQDTACIGSATNSKIVCVSVFRNKFYISNLVLISLTWRHVCLCSLNMLECCA